MSSCHFRIQIFISFPNFATETYYFLDFFLWMEQRNLLLFFFLISSFILPVLYQLCAILFDFNLFLEMCVDMSKNFMNIKRTQFDTINQYPFKLIMITKSIRLQLKMRIYIKSIIDDRSLGQRRFCWFIKWPAALIKHISL